MMRVVFALSCLAACGAPAATPTPPPSQPPFTQAWLDRTANPCDSLYQFACGGWLNSTPIPADRTMWDTSFMRDLDQGETLLRQILDDAAHGKGDAANPFATKLGDFYASCLDDSALETSSLETLRAELAKIDAIATPTDLARVVATMHLEIYDGGDAPLFNFYSAHDRDDATQMIGEADEAGLGLPDRDYFLEDGDGRRELRDLHNAYVTDVFALLGEPRAQAEADSATAFAIEKQLAAAWLDRAARRDPIQTHHRLDRAGLRALAPSFDWDTYFAALGVPDVQAINVIAPDFFRKMDEVVRPEKIAQLKPYLRWFATAPSVWLMGKGFVARRYAFLKQAIGLQQAPEHWRTCIDATNQVMPEALAHSYVIRAFSPEAKARGVDMVERIEHAFEANLSALAWMDEPTKAAARAKLRKIANLIGYPATWRDYSGLAIDRHTPLANYLAGVAYESKRQLAKIGKPVDRTEMPSSAQTVDASYSASLNTMSFPAGILQRPFFAPDAPAAANYSGIGFVIGHELTHGFDDQGSRYDGDGNVRNWWSATAGAAYAQKAACVRSQYSGYAVGDVHLDGGATLGENIADNGGLKLALAAFEADRRGRPAQSYAGFSEEQQFFIAFAQAWCTNVRPEAARIQAQTDVHSARRWRVDGSVANLPAFAAAFECKAGAPLAPASRCEVW